MFENLFNIGLDYGHITWGRIRLARSRLLMAVLMALVLVMLMLGINLAGYKTWNAILFLVGTIIIAGRVTAPTILGTAGAAGGAVAYLGDRDVSQGVLEGFKTLYKLTIGVLAGFWIVAGLLVSWSFEESPLAFFVIMACSIGIMVVMSAFGIKSGKKTAYAVIGYTAIIMATAFWQTLTADQKQTLTLNTSGSSNTQTVELADWDTFPHKANFLGMPVGHEILIKGYRPNQQIVVLVDPSYQHILNAKYPHIKGVKVLGACARVVRPKSLTLTTKDGKEVGPKFKTERGLDTNTMFMVMSNDTRVLMVENGYNDMNMDVIVTLIVKGVGPEICANYGL